MRLVQTMSSRNLMSLSLSFNIFQLCLGKGTVFTKQKETLLLLFSLTFAPCSASLGISHHSFASLISAAPASFPLCFPRFLSCFCLPLPTVPLLILLLCPSCRCEHHSSVSLPCSSCFFSQCIQALPLVYLPSATHSCCSLPRLHYSRCCCCCSKNSFDQLYFQTMRL